MQTIKFSPFIIGTMRLGVWGAKLSSNHLLHFIESCLEAGLNDFDHADIYGHYTTEDDFGQILQQHPSLRQRIQITTKCGIKLLTPNRPQHKIKSYDSSPEHIFLSVENSLKALHTDYIDLLLIHRPDFLMNPEEVAETFSRLKAQGKVRHFGVSNFLPAQFDLLNQYFPLVTNQIEASILHRTPFTDGTLDQCLKHKIRPTAWSPLGGGTLFKKKKSEKATRIYNAANELSLAHLATVDQILLAWLLKHPSGIIPVLGTSKIERVEAAQAALSIQLSHGEWYELWQAAEGKEVA